MKKTIQKILITGLAASSVLLASLALAGNITNTKHNFAVGGGTNVLQSNDITQVCVFCHTPHNAVQTKLLWNKSTLSAATSFRLYTSSGSLTNVVRTQSALTAGSPSLLCLSCHDGKTAMNVVHTVPSGAASAAAGGGFPAGSFSLSVNAANGFTGVTMPPGAYNFGSGTYDPSNNIGMTSVDPLAGDNLTDDHPIGFSYSDVLAESSVGLYPLANAQAAGIRFYGAKNKVECSSCHDPHVDYSAAGNPLQKPFLVRSNAGSSLCLACHNK